MSDQSDNSQAVNLQAADDKDGKESDESDVPAVQAHLWPRVAPIVVAVAPVG